MKSYQLNSAVSEILTMTRRQKGENYNRFHWVQNRLARHFIKANANDTYWFVLEL